MILLTGGGGGGASSRGEGPGGDPPPGTATAAGGTHLTGMHSCSMNVQRGEQTFAVGLHTLYLEAGKAL